MAETLRIGIVGAGGIVKTRHLPGFQALDGVEVVAVCNRSEASGRAVAAAYGIPEVQTDWYELVRRPDLDVVVVGTWPYLHRDICGAALMEGKHVFCQARMTLNYADAKHMYELSQLTDRVTAICPPPHVLAVEPLFLKLRDEGFLGDLRLVRLQALTAAGADPSSPANWRQIAAYSGLNTMAVGIWLEILLKWCGPVAQVAGSLRTWIDQRPNPLGGTYQVSIPDSVTALLQFANGAQGVCEWSAVAHHGGGERLELYGSDGTIVHQVGRDELLVGRAAEPGLRPLAVPAELRGEWRVEANFIDAIRHGTPVDTDFAAGLRYMELLEALYRSHQHGSSVRLPLA
ncbi:MAG: Gfo/Idh/MocA family oxidoreductase [Fimbriimonadaceae bacterium]|nr:Gfo/Idh/MocA family oxidoreductase [Fimbriimonadaceae bacterium]